MILLLRQSRTVGAVSCNILNKKFRGKSLQTSFLVAAKVYDEQWRGCNQAGRCLCGMPFPFDRQIVLTMCARLKD